MKFIFLLFFSLIFSGCDVIENISDDYALSQAKNKFLEMCESERGSSLLICGKNIKFVFTPDNVDYDPDNFSTLNGTNDILEYVNFALDRFNSSRYKYGSDKEVFGMDDFYTYLFPDSNGFSMGDCEDYAITFVEDFIQSGFSDSIKIVFGSADGGYHSWVILSKNNKEYVFDTYNFFGKELNLAYSEKHYQEFGVIFLK